MKIVGLETIPVSVPYRQAERSFRVQRGGVSDVIVKLVTDTGLVGWGESCSGADVASVEAAVRAMAPFVIGRDLLPRAQAYVEADLRGAISRTHMVFELIGSRFSDPKAVPFPENLADCIQNQALFVGAEVPNALEKKLDGFPIRIVSAKGIVFERETHHPNGHPLTPLVWLANFLSDRKETLKAGQIVTTGSYAGIVQVPTDTELTVEFGGVGNLSVRFIEA